jgi:hypothetical protein
MRRCPLHHLPFDQDFSDDKITSIKENIKSGLTAGGAPKSNGRKGEMTMFVGNLPFSFHEKVTTCPLCMYF